MRTGNSISASAPGSLMLLGEHAVLHGRRALVCAINRRITVSVSKCSENKLKIFSALGNYEAPFDSLRDHPDFRFILDVVRQYPLKHGIELKIESEFSSDIGFGSSSAVTVATHAVLMEMHRRGHQRGQSYNLIKHQIIGLTPLLTPLPDGAGVFLEELFKRSLATIHRVQGCGSGADVAASVFGGVVVYRAEPLEIEPLKQTFPLTAVYSGSKMKTADVIRFVEERRALNDDYFERIFDRMDASTGEVIDDFPQLGRMLILNQKLMEEMGLCNDALSEIIAGFREQGVPAKISGSGLGDCAVGLGKFPMSGKYKTFALHVEPQGAGLSR